MSEGKSIKVNCEFWIIRIDQCNGSSLVKKKVHLVSIISNGEAMIGDGTEKFISEISIPAILFMRLKQH